MEYVKYKDIVKTAHKIKNGVEKEYELVASQKWSYYIAKAILSPKRDVEKLNFHKELKTKGNNFGRQIKKSDYIDMTKRFVKYVEDPENKRLPNNIQVRNKLMRVSDYTYMFCWILVFYDVKGELPSIVPVNSKAFIKPTENTNKVYDYFVKTFGKITCIDDALEKIAGRGYGYYYDDYQSNIQTIDAMASSTHTDDPNCTDATQAMKNVADGTRKYKAVDCVHVRCRGGDGHVFLRITTKSGEVFYRDPAAVLSEGYVTAIWCNDGTILGINPSWWMSNLNR